MTYFPWVHSCLGRVVGGQRKRKTMDVAQSCGAVGPPVGEEVSSSQFGSLRESPLCCYCWSCFSCPTRGCSWSSFHPSDAHFWSGSPALSPGRGDTRGKKWWTHYWFCGALTLGPLPQSTCYYLFFRVLRLLLHAFCPEFMAAFSGRHKVECAYSNLTQNRKLQFSNYLQIICVFISIVGFL